MEYSHWLAESAKRSRTCFFLHALLVFLVSALPIDPAFAALPYNVIQSGTPLTLGQYCTAVLGYSQHPRCLGEMQGEQGKFKMECEGVPGMMYVAGQGLNSPQDRCIVDSGGGSPSRTISLSASPSSCGTVSGGGTFNNGTTRTVVAVNNPGCLFSSWVELINGSYVVQSWEATYTFTLQANRALVALFGSGSTNYTISVGTYPTGTPSTLTGGGTYAAGSSVTVTATLGTCHLFSSWTENINGSLVVQSWSPTYTFPALKNRNLVAVIGSLTRFPRDLDGDAKSDILWRQNSGPLATWLMNGGAVKQGVSIASVASAWQVAGVGNFDGDSARGDILWRNTSTGETAIWLMNANGTTVKQTLNLGIVPTAWTIVGVGDFDTDNRADILWRHSNGTLAVWLIDGSGLLSPTTVRSTVNLGVVPAEWKVAGIDDFDGDGRFDILWRHDAGGLALWLMDGATVKLASTLGTVTTDWNVAGVGDFDGDCKADILWRHATGIVALWLMNGSSIKATTSIATVGNEWQIVGVGDFDGDSKSDILWRHTGGGAALWLMNAGAVKSTSNLGTVTSDWQVVNK